MPRVCQVANHSLAASILSPFHALRNGMQVNSSRREHRNAAAMREGFGGRVNSRVWLSLQPDQLVQPFHALVLALPEQVFPKVMDGQHPVLAELLVEIGK